MLSNSEFKIHKYNDKYCLNDVVMQCEISKSPKEYYPSVKDKIIYNSQYYIDKDNLFDLLSKVKAAKSKILLQYLQNDNTSIDKLEIVNLSKKDNELINFVDSGKNNIFFNNKVIKYFNYKSKIYFKAKDVAEVLNYNNTKQTIIQNIDDEDKININNLLNLEYKDNKSQLVQNLVINKEIGGVYSIDPPLNLQTKGIVCQTPPSGTLENNKDKIDPNKLNEISEIYNIIKNEDLQTIFINESGLYSLILASKKEEAKKFKRWVTSEVLPSIRTQGTYISTNMIEYSKDELKKYNNKDCVYILHVKNNFYKYGKTSKLHERLYRHKYELEYNNIEKIYELKNMNDAGTLENKIEEFTKINKINTTYNSKIEFFETNKNITIDIIIENIDLFYNNINHQTIIPKNDNNINLLIEKEKTKQLELELAILKEKNKSSTNKIINDTPKQEVKPLSIIEKTKVPEDSIITKLQVKDLKNTNCIDCNKELITKKALRCGPCERFKRLKTGIEMDNRPSYEQLNKDLKELKYATSVAKKYNVSNLCIYKWIKNYEKYNTLVNKNQVGLPEEPTLLENVQKVTIIETPKKSIKQKIEKPELPKAIQPKPNPPKVIPTIKNASPNKQCIDCNVPVYYKSIRCTKCLNKNKIKQGIEHGNRPTLEQLKKDLEELKSYVKVGMKYDVSDNTIRKWIRRYEDNLL
jgi:prophage antirepressor-like protein/transposase